MEKRMTSPKGDPPYYSNNGLLNLPKASQIIIFRNEVTIYSGEDEGFEECKIPYGAFLVRMPSSSIQVESIDIDIDYGTTEVQFEEVCKIVRTMPSLKDLTLNVSRCYFEWAEGLSELLLDMRLLHKFSLRSSYIDDSTAKLLVDTLLELQGLQIFELCNSLTPLTWTNPEVDLATMRHWCRYLQAPSCVLTRLEFRKQNVSDEAVRLLASVLGKNKSLQRLVLGCDRKRSLQQSGIGSIGDALRSNTTLKSLAIWYAEIGALEMKKLEAALIPDSSGSQPNSTVTELDLSGCQVEGGNGVEHLCTIIKCNTSLVKLFVSEWMELHHLENVEKLLTSLQSNRTLKYLPLKGNTGIGGKKVFRMIMDMLLHNRTILDINLQQTPLHDQGDAEIVYAELRKRQEDYELWLSVADMPPVSPNSARIFLCGNGEAGKTTICQKWDQDVQPQRQRKKRHLITNLFWKNGQQANKSRSGEPSENANQRTRGIEVHKLVWGTMNISLWDMAGQEEYHSFHDLVVPNDSATGNCCIYLIVCDPSNRPLDAIKTEIHYWLKFVASNTRKSESYRPHVTILMTHLDLWRNDPHLPKLLEDIIMELRVVFRDHLSFDEKSSFIPMDNEGAESCDASKVKKFAEEYLSTLSTNVPKVLKATVELQSIVAEWNAKHVDQPFVDWKTFEELCEVVDELKPSVHLDEAILKKKKVYVATALHEGGHIMYYEDLNRVIMNPGWFCHDIMGMILFKCSSLNPNYSMISNGTIPQKYLEDVFLESLDIKGFEEYFEDFLSFMVRLQICYKDTNGNFLFPSLFKSEKEVNFSWPARKLEDDSDYSYIGTSLASKEPTATILTAGFFPRLQVFLQKFAPGVARRSYKSFKDSIQFSYGCSDVYIEYKNDRIDIMSQSSGPKGFELHAQIIKAINDLRSSAMLGCSGVDFEELILRPYCVEELSPYEVRWNQVVSKRELKKEVTSVGDLTYQHYWEGNESRGVPGGFDSAESLLPPGDWQDVLRSCSQKLDVVENTLASKKSAAASASVTVEAEGAHFSGDLEESEPHSPGCSYDSQHLKKFLESEFGLLHMKLDKNHDEMKGILRGLKRDIIRKQEVLHSKVSSSMSNLMEFSIHLLQSRVPKYPIFIPDPWRKNLKQVVKQMVPGLTSGRLYFFCEHRDGFHVPDQLGLHAQYGTDATRKFGIVMFWGLSVVTMLLKVGIHWATGMGDVVSSPRFKQFMASMDSHGSVDMSQPSGPMLEFLPDELRKGSTISSFDNEVAEDWLVDYLRSKCGTASSLHEKLGLNKVVYNERSGSNGVVAWICDDHLERGMRDGILRPLGNSF